MTPLTDGENESYEKQKVCYICKKQICTNENDFRQYKKLKDHCHFTGKFRGTNYLKKFH